MKPQRVFQTIATSIDFSVFNVKMQKHLLWLRFHIISGKYLELFVGEYQLARNRSNSLLLDQVTDKNVLSLKDLSWQVSEIGISSVPLFLKPQKLFT